MATMQFRLRSLRKINRLTLDELAAKTGSTKSYMWELENKPAIRPSARKILNLAAALDTTVEYIMDGDTTEDANEKTLLRVYRSLSPKMQNAAVGILKVLA